VLSVCLSVCLSVYLSHPLDQKQLILGLWAMVTTTTTTTTTTIIIIFNTPGRPSRSPG